MPVRPDIVIVKPGSQKKLYGELSSFKLTAVEPPLWGAILAAFLRERGYGVELIDAEVMNWDYEETARNVADLKPGLVLLSISGTNPSASTMNMSGAGKIFQYLKKIAPNVPAVISGLHPSALPERTMNEEPVDYLCQGEGFYTLPALIDALKNGRSVSSIPGLWYREEGEVVGSPPAPLWENLDELPPPAWDLLPIREYRAHNWHCFDHIDSRQPYAVLYTSLGCPFKCHFCCINALFGKSGIRRRSPENVINEIDFMVKTYGVKNIKIIDEMFAMKDDHVNRLCDLIIERDYDLNMWAYARVNTVNETMLSKMKKAGINWVAYGFESGSKRVLKSVNKQYNPDAVMDVVNMTYNQGLYICANYIFGLPEDDMVSMRETLDMAVEINAEWANMYAAAAYPGSGLWVQALAEGWELPGSWDAYSPYGYETKALPTNYLSGPEVLGFRDYAFHAYHESEKYLSMMEKKFGAAVVEHLKQMAVHHLPRKYSIPMR